MKTIKFLSITLITVIIGYGIGLAGSDGGQLYQGTPIFLACVALAFIINWAAFVPAFFLQTEKFYDLTGSLTYLSLIGTSLYLSQNKNTLTYLLAALVIIWAVRLGTFLFSRIHRDGKDDRFDNIKPNFFRFLNAWSIQALWVVLTAAPVFVAISTVERQDFSLYTYIGLILWVTGFAIEVIADQQKTKFKKNPKNKGKFINTGLWSRSRHPNYFGEILLWFGVSVIVFPLLQGWQYAVLISPIFVTFLLTRVSGVPMLAAKGQKKWGDQADYQEYLKNTPVLIPRL